ncbi:SRA stem-loop-interacting RNA-binding protein, mitochondrial-like [Saccoglossus kowalevskii]|uniref:SRA stem-loop-interacting RNA-binding protein, mitochondrial-like n=1 Tax=Saccoglossus kowalevskii TaxID=10224 RepID=A0ABM0MXU0_SACKO|nr:PREDICTED: SRA stem-loop-interacting RNA-binding protein, mitochondrial-like [Saccoglossus kowalevskii]
MAAVRRIGQQIQSLKVYIGRVPWTVSQKELKDYFSQYGLVKRATLPFDRETGFHKRFGFIEFQSEEGYNNTIQRPYHVIEGTRVFVRPHAGSTAPGRPDESLFSDE